MEVVEVTSEDVAPDGLEETKWIPFEEAVDRVSKVSASSDVAGSRETVCVVRVLCTDPVMTGEIEGLLLVPEKISGGHVD